MEQLAGQLGRRSLEIEEWARGIKLSWGKSWGGQPPQCGEAQVICLIQTPHKYEDFLKTPASAYC